MATVEIRNIDEYLERLVQERVEDGTTLSFALDIRKFEIELYWKRAAYFWALLAVTFGAYFALQDGPQKVSLVFLVTCIGLLLSLAWYLVNRGSKYWQENWERHVDVLETKAIGSLYKTTISPDEYPWKKLSGGYPYSVSKINQLISLYIFVVGIGLFIGAIPMLPKCDFMTAVAVWLLAVTTVVFVVLLLTVGRSRPGGEPRRINFRESRLESMRE